MNLLPRPALSSTSGWGASCGWASEGLKQLIAGCFSCGSACAGTTHAPGTSRPASAFGPKGLRDLPGFEDYEGWEGTNGAYANVIVSAAGVASNGYTGGVPYANHAGAAAATLGGALSGLPTIQPDPIWHPDVLARASRLQRSVGDFSSATTASFARVPVTGPLLAVHIRALHGVLRDAYAVKPYVRVHVLDGRTGRYLCPPAAAIVMPLQVPGAPPVPSALSASSYASLGAPAAYKAPAPAPAALPASAGALAAPAAAASGTGPGGPLVGGSALIPQAGAPSSTGTFPPLPAHHTYDACTTGAPSSATTRRDAGMSNTGSCIGGGASCCVPLASGSTPGGTGTGMCCCAPPLTVAVTSSYQHVPPMCTHPALNASVLTDAAAADVFAASQAAANKPYMPVFGSSGAASDSARGGYTTTGSIGSYNSGIATGAGSTAMVTSGYRSLAWEETLVFPVPLAHALSPHSLIIFEVVDDNPTLPRRLLTEGRGEDRIAWGLYRPVDPATGDASPGVYGLLPHAMASSSSAAAVVGGSAVAGIDAVASGAASASASVDPSASPSSPTSLAAPAPSPSLASATAASTTGLTSRGAPTGAGGRGAGTGGGLGAVCVPLGFAPGTVDVGAMRTHPALATRNQALAGVLPHAASTMTAMTRRGMHAGRGGDALEDGVDDRETPTGTGTGSACIQMYAYRGPSWGQRKVHGATIPAGLLTAAAGSGGACQAAAMPPALPATAPADATGGAAGGAAAGSSASDPGQPAVPSPLTAVANQLAQQAGDASALPVPVPFNTGDSATSQAAATSGFISPSPDAFLQYRQRERLPLPLSLEICVFGAVVPAVRYVYPMPASSSSSSSAPSPTGTGSAASSASGGGSTGTVGSASGSSGGGGAPVPIGCVYSYPRTDGSVVQISSDVTAHYPAALVASEVRRTGGILHPHSFLLRPPYSTTMIIPTGTGSGGGGGWRSAQVSPPLTVPPLLHRYHPALGRPPFALQLPTDVICDRLPVFGTGATGSGTGSGNTARANRDASSAATGSGTGKRGPMSRRTMLTLRGPKEPCLSPSIFLDSLPTGKSGAMCVSFSPDGACIAVGCADDLTYPVRVFDVDNSRPLTTLSHHGSLVYALAWSADSQWLASASGDGTACVWHIPHPSPTSSSSSSATAGAPIPSRPHSIALHTPATYVYSVSFHPRHPQLMVTGSYDGALRLWDTRVPVPVGSSAASFAAGSSARRGSRAGAGAGDDSASAPGTPTSPSLASASARDDPTVPLAPSPTGTGGPLECVLLGYIGGDPRDPAAVQAAATASAGNLSSRSLASTSGGIGMGSALGLGGRRGSFTGTGLASASFTQAGGITSAGTRGGAIGMHTSHVNAIEWDVTITHGTGTGSTTTTTAAPPTGGRPRAGSNASAASGAGGAGTSTGTGSVDVRVKRLITADGSGCIIFWEPPTGNSLESASDPTGYTLAKELRPSVLRGVGITSVKVRPGTSQVAVLAHSNVLRLFDTSTYGAIRAFPNVHCLVSRIEACFSPDGQWLLAGSEDGTLSIWNVDAGTHTQVRALVDDGRRALVAYPSTMYGVAWHPGQHMVAVCSFGGAYPVMLVGAHRTGVAGGGAGGS